MLTPTIKLKKNLWAKIKRCAEAGGYSSPQEFVEHVLEKEISKIEEAESNEEIANKLKGLGYLE
jgi:metal-responsive CopG/Arc/MetJ family transcriptional regulator